jgi:hypothetical protein
MAHQFLQTIEKENTINYADVAQLVERRLAKAKVAGSRPVVRSISVRKHHLLCASGVFLLLPVK